eukprot:m.142126 g.142126  ORF g.142126 m.142126 type:complete len:224 (+) comp14057_c0_seq8:238-909(+)
MEVELDGTTDIAPRPSIDSIPLPFADASGGSGCREVTRAYNVMKMVGKGTYGEVSKAQLKGSKGDAVALKKLIFDKKSYQSGGFPVTAIREIAILKRLKHENIVDLREVTVDSTYVAKTTADGGFSMVLGYMDYDLAGLLERGIRFSVAEVYTTEAVPIGLVLTSVHVLPAAGAVPLKTNVYGPSLHSPSRSHASRHEECQHPSRPEGHTENHRFWLGATVQC